MCDETSYHPKWNDSSCVALFAEPRSKTDKRKGAVFMKRSLLAKLLLPLGILVVLFVASLSVTFFVTSGQARDGVVINLAGRQRMLSQKMAKDAYLYLLTSDASFSQSWTGPPPPSTGP